jgi:uncharacterized protein (DUF58 family)
MIVPSQRLLWLIGLLLFPVAVLGALLPGAAWIALAVLLVIAIAVLADLLLSRGSLDDAAVSLASPQRTFLRREQHLPVKITSAVTRKLRVGLALPGSLQAAFEDTWLNVPAGDFFFDWAVTPQRRGHFTIPTAHLEAPSALGLWDLRRALPLATEVRVYPNVREGEALSALQRDQTGIKAIRQVGKGRDFEKLREYLPGDSLDEIHWKATARRGQPITKVFQIERTQEIYVIVDSSRLSARLVDGQSALDRYLTSALVLGLAAEKRGDLFGLVTFADQVTGFVRARNGKSHYAACRDSIYRLESSAVPADFDELFAFLRSRLRRRALLIVLTNLDDPVLAESFTRASRLLSQKHLVVAGMLAPPGAEPLFSSDATDQDDIYRKLGGHLAWRSLRQIEIDLQRHGVRFRRFPAPQLSSGLIDIYDEIKQRQLL